jgi:hydrogenase maturation protease
MSAARIIGLGQALAGDDGVGLAVIAHLRQRSDLGDVELCEASDPSELVALLAHDRLVVIVDALLGTPAGTTREIGIAEIDAAGPSTLSSHGMGLSQAIELARTLAPDRFAPRLHIVAVTIARPRPGERRLSPAVAAAVPHAAAIAVTLAGG